MELYYILFICSIIMLFTGHYFRILRWRQFIKTYENIGRSTLLYSLILGYIINFIIPIRLLGDVIRGIYSGRKLKNGYPLAFASIILERCLDVFIVAILFIIIQIFNPSNHIFLKSCIFYTIFSLLLIILLIFCIKYSILPKRFIKQISSIFNNKIKLVLMTFFFSFIITIKDIFNRWDKKLLLLNTTVMWGFYLSSYYLFSQVIYHIGGTKMSLSHIFYLLFSKNNMDMPTFVASQNFENIWGISPIILTLYILTPLFIMLAISLLQKHQIISVRQAETLETINLLPQIKEKDRLNFLERYFSEENREYMNLYINLNSHINILEDFSAGSNATTMLCMNQTKTFYRKYAFGSDGQKLLEQLKWLESQRSILPLCNIIHSEFSDKYCCYDMEYSSNAIGMFRYIHSNPLSNSQIILSSVLDTLNTLLYTQNKRQADPKTIQKYINDKVFKNLDKIKNAKQFHEFIHAETIVINGKSYKNLPLLKHLFSKNYLEDIFSKDSYSTIHGDLTIENIICYSGMDTSDLNYYIIDPNTGNIHDSCFLDYGKLLQSLHGGYEFLMLTDKVTINKNYINYSSTRSSTYDEMFQFLKTYLYEHFSKEEVRSIFFHEMVHWLRLLPYKIEKNGERACLFYAGFIMVCNDIEEWFIEGDSIL